MLPRGYGQLTGGGLLKLVGWLTPHLGTMPVTALDLDAGDSIAPDAIKKALTMLPSLTSLGLQGKKITGAVLKHAAKQPW